LRQILEAPNIHRSEVLKYFGMISETLENDTNLIWLNVVSYNENFTKSDQLGPVGDSIFQGLTVFTSNIYELVLCEKNNFLYNGMLLLGTLAAY
jgi:hypothetical protein